MLNNAAKSAGLAVSMLFEIDSEFYETVDDIENYMKDQEEDNGK